jgi:hypothetical protein
MPNLKGLPWGPAADVTVKFYPLTAVAISRRPGPPASGRSHSRIQVRVNPGPPSAGRPPEPGPATARSVRPTRTVCGLMKINNQPCCHLACKRFKMNNQEHRLGIHPHNLGYHSARYSLGAAPYISRLLGAVYFAIKKN